MRLLLSTLLPTLLLASCSSEPTASLPTPTTQHSSARLTRWLVGSAADVMTTTTGGNVLMGGSTDVDAAIQWMIQKSGGGDFVVIRASGSDGYNPYIYSELGGVNSCETILIDSRNAANDAGVETTLRNAEAVFIAGGDQANYVNYWKDTKVEAALNYLRNVKQVPIGGTSAGCAIQGATYFAALNGTITSADALANPYNRRLTLGRNDFLNTPYLDDLITDTHFNNPDRRGRLLTFMARMSKDYSVLPRGVGVDERTAVCIDANGQAKVFGNGTAFFLRQNGSANTPERCVSGQSLDWYRSRLSVSAYKIPGTATGTGTFNFTTWIGTGGTAQYYYVDKGVLGVN